MKNVLFVTLILLKAACTMAQADYPAALSKFQRYYTAKQSDSLFNMFSANMKAALPLDKTTALMESLHIQLGEIKSITLLTKESNYIVYKATFDKSICKLILALNNDNLLEGLRLMPFEEVKAVAKDTDNVTLNGIHGTLTLPDGNKIIPVVLVIAGSGPVDRNGNSFKLGLNTNAYKQLATALQENGIACLRYDKRGIGNSVATAEEDLRFEDMVNDAEGFIKMLKADKRFSKVIILGHSEGSLIGMIAAEKAHATGFISVAGAGERADIIIEKQLGAQSKEMAAQATVLLDSLVKGFHVKEPANNLNRLFHASVQSYMISWLKYDPQKEIKKLTLPVLIVQGNTDIQVTGADAALLKKAKPDAVLKEIDQMNHTLKQASSDKATNIATYSNPDLPLKKELTDVVIAFVTKTNTAL
jgi:pimeloyl-ACP methyl ester carboxylesterase